MTRRGTPYGWSGNRPKLSGQQLRKLMDYFPVEFSDHQRKNVEIILQSMFRDRGLDRAYEAKLKLDGQGKPTTWLVKQTEPFRLSSSRSKDVLARRFRDLPEDVQSAVVELTLLRRKETYRHRKKETSEELIHRLDEEPTPKEMFDVLTEFVSNPSRARSEPALRQLVRGLAALWHAYAGEIPRRSVVSSYHRRDRTYREGGQFTELCRCMASFIEESLDGQLRRPGPSLGGLVRQECDILRGELE